VEELRAGRVSHGNEPVLAWQAGNVMFHRNHEGLVKPDKSNRMSKIDGMVALFMAFSECMFAENRGQGSLIVG
jgi:phage terminase large subunit-like protein